MTEAEREFKEWQRQLAMRAAASDMREENARRSGRPIEDFETWWACEFIADYRNETL